MASEHSAIIGGSTAGRLLNCPGSYRACLDLPASANVSSGYANEGTAMHAVMAQLMTERARNPLGHAPAMLDRWIGNFYYDRSLTRAHVDEMILPALERLAALEERYGGGFRVVGVEERVKFPGVVGAYGTADLLLSNDEYLLLIDWKFGQGLQVLALYEDDVTPGAFLVNPQLLFYTCAAKHTIPKRFTRRRIVAAIVQPRFGSDEDAMIDDVTHTEILRVELKRFIEDVHHAVLLATDRDPPLAKGEHCRWCPAKVACRLWTSKIFDLALIDPKAAPARPVPATRDSDYGIYLGRAKALLDMMSVFKTEIDAQMHSYLEAGGTIPGWRLKQKLNSRKWVDADTVEERLRKLGFKAEQIWQEPKLATFAATDATARKLGVKVPDELRVAPPSTETVVTTSDDPAPIVDRSAAASEFKAALEKIAAEI